ncbi:MAG: hypothetical protein GWP61_25450 [Chloroflexi bacterium]|jgi:GMP synthase-like glutamine amidotransferase|nr:hypothetical protein [Chloroflexota bacterium]
MMKVGILNAINPHESKVNWGGSPVDAYIRFLQSVDAPFEYEGYEAALGQLPASPFECEAYVITGSPRGAYDADPWIADLMQFIPEGIEAGQKFAGICFGHQVLAQALGGRVQKSEKGWGLGLKSLEINETKPWMNGQANGGSLSLYFAHQDQVQELPPGAELLGGSEFCPIGLYSIADQVFAVQGHPEFTLEIMQDILARKDSDDDVLEAAASSLNNGTPDGRLVAQWIVNFLAADS